MNRFAIARPESFARASTLLRDGRYELPVIKAGGMDVVDHMKEGLIEPDLLVDVKRLRSTPNGPVIRREGDQIRIEATTRLAELVESDLLAELAPVVGRSVAEAATPQVRNVATVAGNLLQRPRCWYYRGESFNCLKKGGHTCYAVEGENRYHAIFGGGPCHIVHPSNLAPALVVCGGRLHVVGGDRTHIDLDDLYHLPDRGILDEANLEPAEVVTHITLSPSPQSGFYAVKEKQSFDWPLVMAAVTLEVDGRRIERARVCGGAVAPVPWPLPRVERALRGVRVDDDDAIARACAEAGAGARPMSDNAYKVQLLPVAVTRAVARALGRKEVT